MWPTTILATVFFLTSAVNADTSLWIPGFDPQPISAGVLGVGSDGRTTWQLQQGSLTGSFTDSADEDFPGTVTMVQGPSDAVVSFAVTTEGQTAAGAFSCAINNGVAICVDEGTVNLSGTTDTETETVTAVLVQGGGPISGATGAGPASATSSAGQTHSTGSNQASAGSSPTSSGAGATGSASGKNSAGRFHITGGLLGLAVTAGGVVGYVL